MFVFLVVVLSLSTGLRALGADPAPMPVPAAGDAPVPFAEVVKAAAADAARLPADLARQTRYLDARHVPAALRRETFAVLAYHVNSLSREVRLTPPRQVTAWLWAVRLDDYRWDARVWEDLARVNVYYAIKVAIKNIPAVMVSPTPAKVKRTRKVLKPNPNGHGYVEVTEEYEEEVPPDGAAVPAGRPVGTAAGPPSPPTSPLPEKGEDFIPAPWLPPAEVAALVGATGSKTPIVRADQLVFQTGAQADARKGHGYYDWFGFKKLGDAEKLAALDRKAAAELYRELAAITVVSGVALNNRQLFRFATLTGAWWESRDVKANDGARNAVGNLLDDFRPDAFEIVFTLPNGLPAYYLANAAGEQQDTAPDFIASDHRSTGNDRRIHAAFSCVACHADGGLRPIRDWSRKIYNPETGLGLATLALDQAKARRVESVYLGPLERAYRRDAGDFAEAVAEVSGLKPAELAKAYADLWARYLDEPVTLARAAAEAGVTPDQLRDRLRAAARAKGLVDPVLAVYLLDDPPPVRREHFEERFPLLMLILGGANP